MNVSNNYTKIVNTATRNLVFYSGNRSYGSNVNWVTKPNNFNCKYLALRYINFVNNSYMIDIGSNVLRISGVSYTIPTGQYSINQLISAINSLGSPLTFSYSSTTNKITVTSALSDNMEFSSTYNNIRLGRMLGFLSSTSDNIIITASTTSIATYQVNLNRNIYVDVISNELARFTGSSFGDANSSLLYRIPIQQFNQGASVLIEIQTPKFLGIGDNQVGSLSFSLIDDFGQSFNLDPNCEVSLVFDCIL